MEDFQVILQRKIKYYGKTEAAYEFAADEFATRKMIDENLSMLKMAELHMDERACLVLRDKISELQAMIKPDSCPNCKEIVEQCACMRNICHKCGKPVGNITFTVCDDCWDETFKKK